jgi:hypothetical protein
MNDRTLFLRIKDAAPGNVSMHDIKAVLDGMGNLETAFLRKKTAGDHRRRWWRRADAAEALKEKSAPSRRRRAG